MDTKYYLLHCKHNFPEKECEKCVYFKTLYRVRFIEKCTEVDVYNHKNRRWQSSMNSYVSFVEWARQNKFIEEISYIDVFKYICDLEDKS